MKVSNSDGSDYNSIYEWDCSVQCGGQGLVIGRDPYTTAFFEAFPKNPSCFLRGEGATIEDAEKQCMEKYLKVKTCNHEMERRDRTDGYGYCKHCSYASRVFEPLTKCCKCGVPTAYALDYKNRNYCQKHAKYKPKNPNRNAGWWTRMNDMSRERLPRKLKKLVKQKAVAKFANEFGCTDKLKFHRGLTTCSITSKNKVMYLSFRRQIQKLIQYKS